MANGQGDLEGKNMRKILLLCCLLLAVVVLSSTASSVLAAVIVDNGASVGGVLYNQSGTAVSGAKVSILDNRQILVASAITNEQGAFEIDNLQIGSFEIVVEHD